MGTPDNGTDLYRFFNANSELLYVGISLSAVARAGQHRSTQPWWPQVARMEVERHPNRAAAIEAERVAIVAERPRFNVVHNATSPAVKNAAWSCGACGVGVTDGYVQANRHGSWACRCKRCDDGEEFYWIDVNRIATYEDVAIWTKHLLGKQWFDIDDWTGMFRQSCRIPQWVGAVLHGRDAYVQHFWIHRQSA